MHYKPGEMNKLIAFLQDNQEMQHKEVSEFFRSMGYTYSVSFVRKTRIENEIPYVNHQYTFLQIGAMHKKGKVVDREFLRNRYPDLNEAIIKKLLDKFGTPYKPHENPKTLLKDLRKSGKRVSPHTPIVVKFENRTIHAVENAISKISEVEKLRPVRVNTFAHMVSQLTANDSNREVAA